MRIYQDDCICPTCIQCDIENDLCKIGRWRYPTDGCFDYQEEGQENNTLENLLANITRSIEREQYCCPICGIKGEVLREHAGYQGNDMLGYTPYNRDVVFSGKHIYACPACHSLFWEEGK